MNWHSRSHGRRANLIERRPVVNGLVVVMVLLTASVISAAGADSSTIATDAFTRTATTGWGTADVGGSWESSAPASLSVAPGAGKIVGDVAGEGRDATLAQVSESDVDLQAIWSVNKVATGSGIFVSSVARQVAHANEYRAQVQLKPNGSVRASIVRVLGVPVALGSTAVAGLRYAPGTALRTRFQVEGTDLRFKVWAAAKSEPAQWLVEAKDTTPALQSAGAIGLLEYLSGSSTNLPVTMSVAIFDAKTIDGAAAPVTTTTDAATTTTAAPTTTTTTAAPDPETPPTPEPDATTPPPSGTPVGTTVGATKYTVPAGAIVVSPTGKDSAAGTSSAPLHTLARAIAVAPSGKTIVLRAGSYNEAVQIPSNKKLTVQSWPGEAVWLDGSIPVTSWVKDGSTWRHDGWTKEFDSSPTDTRGAPDNAGNWAYVSPNYPMASHPDQVWIGSVAMRQVGSRAQVVAGSFFHDKAANRLYIGSNPGTTTRASNLQQAIRISSNGTIIRGFGIRRYAPSVPDFGAVLVENANDVAITHVAIVDNATVGVAVIGLRATITNVVLARNGLIGMRATKSDGLVIDRVLVEGNNSEHFNSAPVAGGIKVSRTRTLTLRDSVIRNNLATGFWSDVSNYNLTVSGNQVRGNSKHGIFLEISARALVADNVIEGNKSWGLKIDNTDQVRVWNNTFIGNNGSIWVVQEKRRPSNFSVGRDNRQPYPDPTMTWVIKSVTIANNVMANQVGPQVCIVCVQDGERLRTAEQMGVGINASVYNRASSSAPSRLITWSRGKESAAQYKTLPPFRDDTNQETAGYNIDGSPVVNTAGQPTAKMPAMSGATPLPSAVASAIGKPSGARRFGAWVP